MDELEHILRLRELWSKSMTTYSTVFISLSAAIVSFFLSQYPNFKVLGYWYQFYFVFIGWLLFSFVMLYWRSIISGIDKQIVEFYPRMLEIEKKEEMETQTAYYYRNLSIECIFCLANKLEVNVLDIKNFKNFKEKAKLKNLNTYDLLLDVWNIWGYKSIGSRGHDLHDNIVYFLICVSFVIILFKFLIFN